ncbi:MAG TPA: class I SAM-dependent methyltransferase [Magnetospirillum sp.]|jgi:SAM-dependent methyltransferase|nr:class I SAM-dependent methyltransferase [Magnetospirillum sp.]
MAEGTNDETLRSYRDRVQEYVDRTAHEVTGASKDWIDAALSGLPASARVLELGSAFGRDAAYMAAKGYRVECTDAVPEFVERLRESGFNARPFNALTDELEAGYDLILANAVLLHFSRDEFARVLGKLRRSLGDGGRFAFSLKRGRGEEWSRMKLGAPRFFCYWEPHQLEAPLREAGFASWSVNEALTGRVHAEWLYVIATAPKA